MSMKFIVEPHEEQEDVYYLHFDVPVEGLLPRLCTIKEHKQPMGQMMVATVRQCLPLESLKGIESLAPTSRYVIMISVGKCFSINDVLEGFSDHLEIDMVSEDEWANFAHKVEEELNQGYTIQDQTREEIARKIDLPDLF